MAMPRRRLAPSRLRTLMHSLSSRLSLSRSRVKGSAVRSQGPDTRQTDTVISSAIRGSRGCSCSVFVRSSSQALMACDMINLWHVHAHGRCCERCLSHLWPLHHPTPADGAGHGVVSSATLSDPPDRHRRTRTHFVVFLSLRLWWCPAQAAVLLAM